MAYLVYDELKDQQDDLADWVRGLPDSFFISPDAATVPFLGLQVDREPAAASRTTKVVDQGQMDLAAHQIRDARLGHSQHLGGLAGGWLQNLVENPRLRQTRGTLRVGPGSVPDVRPPGNGSGSGAV